MGGNPAPYQAIDLVLVEQMATPQTTLNKLLPLIAFNVLVWSLVLGLCYNRLPDLGGILFVRRHIGIGRHGEFIQVVTSRV